MTLDKTNIQRRQDIATCLYNLWTRGGSDPSALAPLILDGRVDVLGKYVILNDDLIEEEEFMEEDIKQVPRIHCNDLSYQEFVTRFMRRNRPVVIQGLTQNWKSRLYWLTEEEKDSNNNGRECSPILRPNLNYLRKEFGSDAVQIHVQEEAGFSASSTARPQKMDMTVSEYADWWDAFHHFDNSRNINTQHNELEEEEKEGEEGPLLYLKDWKFVANHYNKHNTSGNPYVNDAYEWPIYFRDDWLNAPGAMGNAYRFIYLGPRGTVTGLHADVLRSFSWSTNVCGRKLWYLVPPEYTYLLMDCFGKSLARHMHSGPAFLYPGLALARHYSYKIFQEADETLFVPSEWHHTVENLAPTLSINHNWLNGSNIHWGWEKLHREISALQQEEQSSAEASGNKVEDSGLAVASSSNTTNSTNEENVGDELFTLALVLSNKVNSMILSQQNNKDISDNTSSPWHDEETTVYNLEAIFPILEGIKSVVCSENDYGLSKQWDCDIYALLSSVKTMLAAYAEKF